jgi:hypothetical protein
MVLLSNKGLAKLRSILAGAGSRLAAPSSGHRFRRWDHARRELGMLGGVGAGTDWGESPWR